MSRRKEPRVFSIEPGQPFLPTVVKALCDGELVDGFQYNGDPLLLARATIFVPTRRAAREIRSEFMDYFGGESVLLPRIRPLGEFDEENAVFQSDAENLVKTLPPVDPLERQLFLGGLLADWNRHLSDRLRALYEQEDIVTPVSVADAFWLARELGELLDQLQTEDLTFDQIDQAASELDLPAWWGVTHSFLRVLSEEWPAKLRELGRVDLATHRNEMLRGEAKRLANLQPRDPVIVAGSTGTIPATAELISTIAKLPSGAVVLPGYDCLMDDTTRIELEDSLEISSVIGHPQYGMHQLVLKMGASGLVSKLGGDAKADLIARQDWIEAALLPSPGTARWQELRKGIPDIAFNHVEILKAVNEREEAVAIAVALREAIAEPEVTAALVTPDRLVARRVIGELARYGIEVDDSGGAGFDLSHSGILLGLLFSSIFLPGDPSALLGLLKSPLVRFGTDPEQHGAHVDLFERLVLRGGIGRFDIGEISRFAENQINASTEKGRHQPKWFNLITDQDRHDAVELAKKIEAALNPMTSLRAIGRQVLLKDAVRATILSLEAICADAEGSHKHLYEGEGGQALSQVLLGFLATESGLRFDFDEWPEILRATASGNLIEPKTGTHPRISIWGALEARLQTVDFLVLGGLNEGVWPKQATNDAFLTRGVKARIRMQPPERRIGLAAHDFQMAMGQPRVLLSRSTRLENAPAVASRWLQRLETLAGEDTVTKLEDRGNRYKKIAAAIQKPTYVPSESRPDPHPPLETRPKYYSVTEIERLRRDPYAIYARRVLDLAPLDPFIRDPDAAMRGTIIHEVLEQAIVQNVDFSSANATGALREIADLVFSRNQLPEDIKLIWQSRFDGAIDDLVSWELAREEDVERRFAELRSGRVPIADSGVSLGGRADRLDIRTDGTVDIIDFKTGGVPSVAQVQSLLAPQMPLEAALLQRGGFDKIGVRNSAGLLYVLLGPKGDVDVSDVRGSKNKFVDSGEIAERAWKKLEELVSYFAIPTNGYVSRAIPAKQHDYAGEYDHLARVMEWSAGVDGNEDGSNP